MKQLVLCVRVFVWVCACLCACKSGGKQESKIAQADPVLIEAGDTLRETASNGTRAQDSVAQIIWETQSPESYFDKLPKNYFVCADEDNFAKRKQLIQQVNAANGYLLARTSNAQTIELAVFKDKKHSREVVAAFRECGKTCECNQQKVWGYTKNTWIELTDSVFEASFLRQWRGADSTYDFILPEFGTQILVQSGVNHSVVGALNWQAEAGVFVWKPQKKLKMRP